MNDKKLKKISQPGLGGSSEGFSRRTFVKGAGITGVLAISAGLTGCDSGTASKGESTLDGKGQEFPELTTAADFDVSPVVTSPITEFADEKTYDIVVVGAGVAGVPAVLTALDEGVSVCCLQKEDAASANGHYSGALVQEASNPVDILKWQQYIRANNSYRVNWDLLSFYAAHSGETAFFMDKQAESVGYPADETWVTEGVELTEISQTSDTNMELLYVVHAWREGNDGLLKLLAEKAEKDGAEFYYNTPGVQLVTDASGAVTGVIGQASDGSYIRFNANKAVILATGDYENNRSMVEKYNPDLAHFQSFQNGRTGDGHLMAIQAGARLVPLGHAKQLHCVFASDWMTSAVPLLSLDMKGKRFMNEECAMTLWHNSLKTLTDQEDRGVFVRLFDDAFETKLNGLGFGTREMLEAYIPGANPENFTAITNWTPSMADVHKADTLDELAQILGVPAESLKDSVEKWNQYCATGQDPEYGLDRRFLRSIDTAPYWGVKQHVRIIAINAGVIVDKNYQVVDADLKPIRGLFAVGTTGGDICGNNDWRMSFGLSNGHCMTGGRYSTLFAIHGKAEATNPVAWNEVKSLYGK